MSVLDSSPPFSCRPLDPHDLDEARAIAVEARLHGAYVHNGLDGVFDEHSQDHVYAIHGAERMFGLIWFGARGNLIVIEREPVDADVLARTVRSFPWEWRIALVRRAVSVALRRGEQREPLVDRQQVYYLVDRDLLAAPAAPDARADATRDPVRRAERRDAKALVAAGLDLNESDLNVASWRVNRAWLRETVRRRIREGHTWVIGPIGAPLTKLDLGSVGAAGAIIEGVYTDPTVRGQGLASRLVANVARELLREVPVVGLHVAAHNLAARRAYERAGMRQDGATWLLLRG